MGLLSVSNRKKVASYYYDNVKERRLLSLTHFSTQWLRICNLFGSHPIVIIKPDASCPGVNYLFKFKLFSWVTLYSFGIIVFSGWYYSFWFYRLHYSGGIEAVIGEYERHLIHGEDDNNVGSLVWGNATHKHFRLDTTTRLCMELLCEFLPVSGIGYLASGFLSTPHLLRFLNGANDFENRIRKLFPGVMDVSLAQLHMFQKRIFAFNMAVFVIFIAWHIPKVYTIMMLSVHFHESQILLAFVIVCLIASHGVLDDTKAIIVLKMVDEYFQQIIDGIGNYYSQRPGIIQVRHIKQWRSLVHLTRKQAKLAGCVLQESTNLTLFGIHVVLTSSTFLVYCFLNKDLSAIVGGCAYGSLAFFLMNYVRLYLKAVLAENIMSKENELAKMIRLLGDRPVDTKFTTASAAYNGSQVEISFITDPIVAKPTKCILNRCVTLKVSLLLGIFRNVSTYAVALIQLDNVHESLSSIGRVSTVIE